MFASASASPTRFRQPRGLVAAFLALLIFSGCQKSAEERAIDEVIRLGGNVVKDGQSPGLPVITVILKESKVTDGHLQLVKSFPQLRTLDLRKTRISDNGLVHLEGLTNLQNLYLDETTITDSGLGRLSKLKALRKLTLNRTAIDDIGADYLKDFPQLDEVALKDTRVSEEKIDDLHKERPNLWIVRDSQSAKELTTLQPGRRPSRR